MFLALLKREQAKLSVFNRIETSSPFERVLFAGTGALGAEIIDGHLICGWLNWQSAFLKKRKAQGPMPR
jgi:hypothetical protein